jgi:hypothetical protein
MNTYSPVIPRALLLFSFVATFAACGRSNDVLAVAPPVQVAFGDWGGDQADVNATSSATHVVLGCAFGDFPGIIALDASGRFMNITGTWNRSTGPIQVNGAMPAVLSGEVIGNYLTFAVAVNDTITKQVSSLGPATVIFGHQATSTVCPL